MTVDFKKCTDSRALNKALQEEIFPGAKYDNDINLAENWSLATENGESYVKNNGLFIVCQSLKAFREKQLPTCLFAHRDMRCDVLGIPMVPGWQIAMFDQCCDHKVCNNEVIKLCVYNQVLTRNCYDYIYYKPKQAKLEQAVDNLLVPPLVKNDNLEVESGDRSSKRRKKK